MTKGIMKQNNKYVTKIFKKTNEHISYSPCPFNISILLFLLQVMNNQKNKMIK